MREKRGCGEGAGEGGSKYARVASPPARPPSSFHLSLLLGEGEVALERTRLKRNNDARASANSSGGAERNLDFE